MVVPCTQMARSLVMCPSSTVRMTAASRSPQNLARAAGRGGRQAGRRGRGGQGGIHGMQWASRGGALAGTLAGRQAGRPQQAHE